MRNLFFLFLALIVVGCGTDVKPTAFVDILRDPSDADTLSACLSEEPTIGDEQITLTLEKQCLVDFSQQDKTDPSLAPSFAKIIANPEVYMDKLLTFEAVVKKLDDYGPRVELYTNDLALRWYIQSHGAPIYRLDEEGEEVPLQPNETYQFQCRIYEMKKNVDWSGIWEIHSEFLVSTNKKILHVPVLVE